MSKSIGATNNGTVNLPCAAEAIYEGKVYKLSTGVMTVCTGVADKAFGIAAQSTRDWQLNSSKVLTSGDYWQFYPMGCQMIVNVQSNASITWEFGDKAVLGAGASAATNGRVQNEPDDSGNVGIGHFIGTVELITPSTSQDVDSTVFVKILLDVTSTEDTTA